MLEQSLIFIHIYIIYIYVCVCLSSKLCSDNFFCRLNFVQMTVVVIPAQNYRHISASDHLSSYTGEAAQEKIEDLPPFGSASPTAFRYEVQRSPYSKLKATSFTNSMSNSVYSVKSQQLRVQSRIGTV